MNRMRRIEIYQITKELINIAHRIEDIACDEEASLENMPESLQDSEIAQKSQAAWELLNDGLNTVYEVIDYLDTSTE